MTDVQVRTTAFAAHPLAIRDEWLLRSLDSLLVPGGFRVVSAGDPNPL